MAKGQLILSLVILSAGALLVAKEGSRHVATSLLAKDAFLDSYCESSRPSGRRGGEGLEERLGFRGL